MSWKLPLNICDEPPSPRPSSNNCLLGSRATTATWREKIFCKIINFNPGISLHKEMNLAVQFYDKPEFMAPFHWQIDNFMFGPEMRTASLRPPDWMFPILHYFSIKIWLWQLTLNCYWRLLSLCHMIWTLNVKSLLFISECCNHHNKEQIYFLFFSPLTITS